MSTNEAAEVVDLRSESRSRVANSYSELLFALSLVPCRACGERDEHPDTRRNNSTPLKDQENLVELTIVFRCSKCKSWRQLIAHSTPKLTPASSRIDFGEGASRLLAPEDFLHELERLLPTLENDPTSLTCDLWPKAIQRLRRALLCANELAKFPLQEGSVLLGRAATVAARARLGSLYERYKEDAPRYQAEAEAAEGNHDIAEGSITPETVRAHELWLKQGQTGEGRLRLKHQRFHGMKLPALPGARWDDIVLFDVDANRTSFEGAEMRQVTWEESRLAMARFEQALLTKAHFFECDMLEARFYSMHLEDGLFEACVLERTIWTGARCDRATFLRCELLDTCFDDAVFTRCDFREQMLGGTKELARFATTKNARFEDCDFRNTDWLGRDLSYATFVRCRFEGAVGRPTAAEGLTLIDCDVDARRLLKMLKG